MVDEDAIAEAVVCGPDTRRHLEGIESFSSAGFDRVYVHQIRPDQDGFLDFYAREVLPEVGRFGDRTRGKPLAA